MGKHIKTFNKVTDYLRAKGTFTDRHVVFIRETNYVDFGDYDNSNLNEFGLDGDLIITAESNPPVFAALNNAGIPYDTTAGGYTIADLAAITDEDIAPTEDGEWINEESIFGGYPIVNFNEFKYFTGIDGSCFYDSANDFSIFENTTTIKRITIPKNVSCSKSEISDSMYYLTLDYVSVDEENQMYDSRGNCNAIISTSTNTLLRASNNTIIPNDVTEINWGAFHNLTISSITIPETVTSILGSAFSNCTNLTSVTIPNSVTVLSSSIFSGCTSLSSITISNYVTSIGNFAFSGCSSLSSLTIPNSVTTIGASAFQGCSNLSSITLPNSITAINNNTFINCTSLTSITIPESVTTIGASAFENCTSLTSITRNGLNNAPSIQSTTFKNVGENGILTVPTERESYYMPWLIRLSAYGWRINDVVVSPPTNAPLYQILNQNGISKSSVIGYRISDLAQLTDNQILSYEGDETEESSDDTCYSIFYQASDLTSFEEFQYFTGISHDITTKTNNLIGNVGFFEGTSISKIVLPPHLSVIGEKCFYCLPINEITIPPSVTTIMYNAFAGCGITKIEIPSSVSEIDERSLACTNLTEIICKGTTAPQYSGHYNNPSPFGNDANNSTAHVPRNGILKYPAGADYSVLLSTSKYYLGYFGWTGEEF